MLTDDDVYKHPKKEVNIPNFSEKSEFKFFLIKKCACY